jgi:hypothetical protein
MSLLTSVIAGDGSMMEGTFTVTRYAANTTDGAGRVVAGAASTFSIDASIQPVTNGRELQPLAEAAHGREVRVVFTATELRTITPAQAPDLIAIAGETWEVIAAERWDDDEDAFTRAHIARVTVP